MPKPTLAELVRETELSVAALEERVRGIDRCHDTDRRHAEELTRLSVDVATVREKVATIEKQLDQVTQRRWTLFVAILSAFLGGALTLPIQLSLRGLTK